MHSPWLELQKLRNTDSFFIYIDNKTFIERTEHRDHYGVHSLTLKTNEH